MAAEAGADRIAAAQRLYVEGRIVSAQGALEGLVAQPASRDPSVRAAALGSLLDICLRSEARACIAKYMQPYLEAVSAAPAANPLLRREQVRRADYYLAYGRYILGSGEVRAGILEGEAWRHENASDAPLYLRRQVLASNILLTLDRPADAVARVDKILSLIASLKNPEADGYTVAWALSDAIATLLDVGDTERAYGLYRAGHSFIVQALPHASLEAATYRLSEARLLQQAGDLKRAGAAVDAALATIQGLELDPGVRRHLLGQTLTVKAVLCAARSDMACARDAIARHPYAGDDASGAPAAASDEQAAYLAARAIVGGLEGRSDPLVVAALKSPAAGVGPHLAPSAELDRLIGLAFATPPGEGRRSALQAAGAQLTRIANRPSGIFGAWARPGAVDQMLIAASLAEPQASNAEANFALFQLAARSGPSFDADALAALGKAKTTLDRRAIHQALRLRARRDRFEREHIQAVATRAMSAAPGEAALTHDPATRLFLRAFNEQIAQAGRGAEASGANLISLKRLQALLKPNEAALAIAPAPGGLAYMCVRRDAVRYARAVADLAKARLDTRLLQLALTSTNAPDATLDAQFPVAAATGLYDVYVRPFEPCLKPGDHILWLSSVATLNLPLSVLLEHAPPARAVGYDLAQADWLVRRYSISYAGSAAMVAAARSGGGRAPAAFDFLGVGDPDLTAAPGAGRRRADLAALPPLPETRDELEASAQGFRNARLLLRDRASEGGFRRELVGSYRYLSFATHGLMRDDIEALGEPALVLTPGAGGDLTNDGLLTASEIADLNLQARFVALSACNTANFDQSQIAQDLPALASAFAVAGTPAVLATLWPVNSETGKRVVAATFEALHAAGAAPAEALAAAQRAFLADPPGPAYRHPRFWAPFVILGDGAAPPPDVARQGAAVVSVEAITQRGGEIIALRRTAGGLAGRFIAGTGPAAAAGVRLSHPDGREAWRSELSGTGAIGFLATFDGRLLAGGYRRADGGRFVPTLDLYPAAGGDPAASWRGEAVSARDAILLGGAQTGAGRAVFVVGEPVLRSWAVGGVAQLHLMSVDAALAPRTLVAFDVPAGMSVTQATVTPLGPDLLLTYTDRAMPLAERPAMTEDDYDDPLCSTQAFTRIERRDGRTGALRQARELPGYVVTAATAADGGVLLGGSRAAGCGAPAKGVVVAVDAGLATRAVYEDATLGVSEVRALRSLPGGRTLVAANKENVLDYRPAALGVDVYAMTDLQRTYSGMLLTLGRDGKASAPTMLDTGLNVFLSAAETDGPGRVVVGGSVGGGAALVRLTAAAGAGS